MNVGISAILSVAVPAGSPAVGRRYIARCMILLIQPVIVL